MSKASHPTWVRGLKHRKQTPIVKGQRSHPTWVRGLKLSVPYEQRFAYVAPYVGAWIETNVRFAPCDKLQSHPTWVRGLKRSLNDDLIVYMESHPTWVRGLKLGKFDHYIFSNSRTLRGCVD